MSSILKFQNLCPSGFAAAAFRNQSIASSKSRSQNLKKNISKRSGKFLKNVKVPTETVVLKVFPVV
ncbi:hypothetical protein [Leptospira borgpetersenii]|uniref:Lipoprotein n=1 Tax=Leptospira borgpetersenii str. Brem 328 TaxID=1049780 RepID=A0ABC9SKD5_LEPBO|nr:hypothetical protein [Leptospira borgpetersenii]AXX15472.1 hypothetical protein C4Q31_07875 [Leptospira borgpetersenii serovar Ceylonica]EMN18145.1 hypothetical protein LEP1GSC056_1629 [Leptospira borgpetersenii str. Brem 328]MBE8258035.1 hypothetical protein [Leptospira borgpetersenii serovar Ballum]MBE8267653.1 hypothetical protein [Leptospira borgpetersenii serovar Ballum]MBE8289915.1 hypothetical protein [Leptospira borgpetersenii serovar Ballum]